LILDSKSYIDIYRTLDILSNIDLTFESLEPTSLLYYDDDDSDHIWILLRSTSNILQVWNQSGCKLHGTICLNNLFEKIGKTDEQLALMEDITQFGSNNDGSSSSIIDQIRITSFLIHDSQLWIGTSTGVIFVFNFSFQRKSIGPYSTNMKSYLRSLSITNHMIEGTTRKYSSPLPDLVNNGKKARSRSDSAMPNDCYNMSYLSNHQLYRITFPTNKTKDRSLNIYRRRKRHHSTITYPIIENHNNQDMDSDDTSTTLTSVKTRSSSPAVISTDEWRNEHRQIKFPNKQQKSLEASATLSFNLVFKAKIADTPVKCICKTKYRNKNYQN